MEEKHRKQYAEEFGLAFEQFGLTRMSGRIMGWLLVCEPPHQSPQDLQEALQASKGSISTNTRMLERFKFVERTSMPGDRRTYFRIRPNAWSEIMNIEMVALTQFLQMTQSGLDQMADAALEKRQRLLDMQEFFAFIQKEFSVVLEHWQEYKQTQT